MCSTTRRLLVGGGLIDIEVAKLVLGQTSRLLM